MLGLGIVIAILGFGSTILHLAGSPVTFRLVALLEPMQPWIGIVIGLIGLALAYFGWKNRAATTPTTDRDADRDFGRTTNDGYTTGQSTEAPRPNPAPRQTPAPPARPAGDGTPGSGTSTGL